MKYIVCIEDEPQIIDLIRLVLAGLPFEVVGAMGGEEGIETVRRLKPDLLLLDLMMPRIDGWVVYRTLRADPEFKSTPVIIVTAAARTYQKAHLMSETGIDDLIVKPFEASELRDSVKRLLNLDPSS